MDHDALWKVLATPLAWWPRGEHEAVLATAASAPRHALSPWALWTLIGVVRHIRRQRRACDLARRHCGVSADVVARGGWQALPEDVPRVLRSSSWTFRFHERGIVVKDHDGYERVDIDLRDGDAEHVDPDLFVTCLESIPGPRESDAQIRYLHASLETLGFAFDELVELGLLVPHPGAPRLKGLSAEARQHEQTISDAGYAFGRRAFDDARERNIVEHAILGDWFQAHRYAKLGSAEWALPYTGPRAAEQVAARRARLLASGPTDDDGAMVRALVELDQVAAAPYVRETLAGPPVRRCVAALQAIRHRRLFEESPDYTAEVLALLRRLDLDAMGFESAIWELCAGYLLERGQHTEEVVAIFPALGEHVTAGIALLAFEHAPGHVVPLLRRALHAENPVVRADAGALLVLLGEPWGIAFLEQALATSDDPVETLEWRVALRLLKDPGGAVAAWEEANPEAADAFEGAMMGGTSWMKERMAMFQHQVNGIRHRREQREKG